MKKIQIIKNSIFCILVLSVFACKAPHEEILIWTDTTSESDTLYQNPIFEPDLADPTVIRASDGWFYAYGTENTWEPGVHRITPIVKSKDLIKWDFVGNAFTTKPTWRSTGGLWAPQIVFNSTDGFYYLYYSLSTWGDSNPGIGVAKSLYPEGPFEDLGKILDSQSSGVANSIDQFFIQTGTGRNRKSYLFWGSFHGIYGVEMTDMKTPKLETKFKIAGNAFEATYIYEYNSKFYIFLSEGSCCEGANSQYRLTVAMADNIKGPYMTKDGRNIIADNMGATPLLRGSSNVGWVGPGHNAEIIKDDNDRYFMLYHAVKYNNPLLPNGATRRPLMMDEIIWVDNWPTIEGGVPSSTQKRAPYFNSENE